MTSTPSLAVLWERVFTQRLRPQRQASPHTISASRDTFRLLLLCTQPRLRKPPSHVALTDRDAPLIVAFLAELEQRRGSAPRRRHLRVVGKGRKERCTPLSKQTVAVVQAWLREPARGDTHTLFPNARGGRLSADGVQYIVAKQTAVAGQTCPSLQQKRVTPHVLRHTTAMELLQAGVDRVVIALWLGHASVETTQISRPANPALKKAIVAKTTPPDGKPGRSRPDDQLLAFLKRL